MNPMQFLKDIKNPKEAVMKILENNPNPIFKDLVQKVEQGDTKSVETFARNAFKEQGRDFDKEINQFMSNFKQR